MKYSMDNGKLQSKDLTPLTAALLKVLSRITIEARRQKKYGVLEQKTGRCPGQWILQGCARFPRLQPRHARPDLMSFVGR